MTLVQLQCSVNTIKVLRTWHLRKCHMQHWRIPVGVSSCLSLLAQPV